MSNTEKINAILSEGKRWCDDCLSEQAGIYPRQTINQICNGLGFGGYIERRRDSCDSCGKHKLTSLGRESTQPIAPAVVTAKIDVPTFEAPTDSDLPGLETVGELSQLVEKFVAHLDSTGTEIYNEFSLQHELGIFLRSHFPEDLVQFERNVGHFFPSGGGFAKREIDIAVFDKRRAVLRYVFELKFPRNGQHPESIFSFCKDVAFLEQLTRHGFSAGAAVIFVDDRLFYSGSPEGIYKYFRGGELIYGRIQKPTGKKDEEIQITGRHLVNWKDFQGRFRYACIEVRR